MNAVSASFFLTFTLICLLLVVILDAADTVLIERAQGKRIDPVHGGKSHISRLRYMYMFFCQLYKDHICDVLCPVVQSIVS